MKTSNEHTAGGLFWLLILITTILLPSCETLPISASYERPGYVLRYDKATGVAIHVTDNSLPVTPAK